MNFADLGLSDNLDYHEIKVHTQEWYDFRMNGIGGSEVGSILALSDYKSSIEVFMEKIGRKSMEMVQNEAMFHGTHLEEYVGNLWKAFDGEGYMSNYDNGVVVRDFFKPDGYITNVKYPHLFASLDGLIPKGQKRLDGAILDKPGILEIKNMSGIMQKKWEDGIPPYYMAQIQMYMVVLEVDYAEIAILKDGRYFQVSYILRDPDWSESIIKNTDNFWNKRVLPAKKAVRNSEDALLERDKDAFEKFESIIQHLEPEADGTAAYTMWLKDTFKRVEETRIGGLSEYTFAAKYNLMHYIEKYAKKQKTYLGNTLRKIMAKDGVDKLDFEEDGYFSVMSSKDDWKNNKVNNKLKKKYTDDEIKKILDRVEI